MSKKPASGPYSIKSVRRHFEIVSPEKKLARLYVTLDPGEAIATARLFAAAPELLVACGNILAVARSHILSEFEGTRYLERQLRELEPVQRAIEKATGENENEEE